MVKAGDIVHQLKMLPAVKVDAAIIKELLGKEATASELEKL